MGGAFLALELPFEGAVGVVGVDHVEDAASGPGEVGGVEPAGFLEQHLFGAARGGRGWWGARRRRRGSRRLFGADRALAQRGQRRWPSVVRMRAWSTRRFPSPRRSPARWVYQSAVEAQPSSRFATWRASISASTCASTAARLAGASAGSRRCRPARRTRGPDHRVSASPPTRAHASATTPAGVGAGSAEIAMDKLNQRPPTPRPQQNKACGQPWFLRGSLGQ